MPTLHLPFDQSPRPRLFGAARSRSFDMGPTGQDLLELASSSGPGTLPELPPVCLVTGDRENVTFRTVDFSWFPRWVLLLSFLPTGSVLLAAIVARLLTRKATGDLPFTDRGWRQWRVAKRITPISVFVAGYALMTALTAGHSVVAGAAWVAVVALPIGLYLAFQRNRMVRPVRITKAEIALDVPSQEAAQAVLDHFRPGHGVQPGPLLSPAR